MNIYVYQVSDTKFDAGFIREQCESRGRIVEEWDVSNAANVEYVARHGSKYGKVGKKVVKLAEFVKSLDGIESDVGSVLVSPEEFEYAVNRRSAILMKTAKDSYEQSISAMQQAISAFDNVLYEKERVIAGLGSTIKELNELHERQIAQVNNELSVCKARSAIIDAEVMAMKAQIERLRDAHVAEIRDIQSANVARVEKLMVDAASYRAQDILDTREQMERMLSEHPFKTIFRVLTGKRISDAAQNAD